MRSLGAESVPEEAWRRVHPISPLLGAWKFAAAILAIIGWKNADHLAEFFSSGVLEEMGTDVLHFLLWALLAFVAVVVLALVYSWLQWRATSYAVVDDAVWFRTGLVSRSQRHARLDRLQAVDIHQPLLGRLFGLGRLVVEVAGGNDSKFTIEYLRLAELEELRAEVLARAAGIRGVRAARRAAAGDVTAAEGGGSVEEGVGGSEDAPRSAPAPRGTTGEEASSDAGTVSGAGVPAGAVPVTPAARGAIDEAAPAPVAPEREVYVLPQDVLVASILRSPLIVMAVLAVVLILVLSVVIVWQQGFSLHAFTGSAFLGPVAVALVFIGRVWSRYSKNFDFRVALSPDGIRLRRGLTDTRSQTIPPHRVHAVQVTQPLLWRGRDWYRVSIQQAGYAGDEGDLGSDVLLPVATREQAELALWLVVRDLGVEDPHALVEDALHGFGAREGSEFVPNGERARWIDPWSWRRRALAVTRTCTVLRTGRWARTMTVVPHARIQSLYLNAGPLQRRLGTVDLHVEIVKGALTTVAHHVEEPLAQHLLPELLGRARERREVEPPAKWMRRVVRTLDSEGLGA